MICSPSPAFPIRADTYVQELISKSLCVKAQEDQLTATYRIPSTDTTVLQWL